ncbi:hypothetical protein BS47DRAFT_1486376 [Hydnum rufescens UP504]|uniref:Uncharacterized protein n=1 Tax=Hydnum rufescens UP504 TaxID=1448309 RepID=A0A9P6AUQ0_9AGAM|nr:hypothetical protein BS47DRAFT_1486376 [Hydnum rufescens UP504]
MRGTSLLILALVSTWDLRVRFRNIKIDGHPLPQQFFSDFTKVAEDEAKHFSLLRRIEELGSFYGAQSVHAGFWEAGRETAHSLSAHLCIIHPVHEARGLDVNPPTVAKFRAAGDLDSVEVWKFLRPYTTMK